MTEAHPETVAPPTADEPQYTAPRAVLDLLCPSGHIIGESLDRRWLWSIHESLTQVKGSGKSMPMKLAGLREALGCYLSETCEHHWEPNVEGDATGSARCLWCEIVQPKGAWFNGGQA